MTPRICGFYGSPRSVVCLQDLLQRRVLPDAYSRPRIRHQIGNIIEADLLRQKQADGFLVGTVQNGAGRSALLRRFLRQTQAGKGRTVRFQKG